MKLLICGGRRWYDRGSIRRQLRRLEIGSGDIVIHGDCSGADQSGGAVAAKLGATVQTFPAEWNKYGRSAGPRRNRQMLEQAESWEGPPHWLGPWNPEDWLLLKYRHYRRLGPADIQLLWSAIDAAGRIRLIATEAFHRGVPVRWFEFDTAISRAKANNSHFGIIHTSIPLHPRDLHQLPLATVLQLFC